MMYRSWEITKNMITSVFINNNYAAVRLDWESIPSEYKDRLVKDFLGHEIEYDDQWYFASIIIPIKNNYLDFGTTYLYVDEYSPDEMILNFIDESVAVNSDWLKKISIDVCSRIIITSAFMDNNQ